MLPADNPPKPHFADPFSSIRLLVAMLLGIAIFVVGCGDSQELTDDEKDDWIDWCWEFTLFERCGQFGDLIQALSAEHFEEDCVVDEASAYVRRNDGAFWQFEDRLERCSLNTETPTTTPTSAEAPTRMPSTVEPDESTDNGNRPPATVLPDVERSDSQDSTAEPFIYIVQVGDTLGSIASEFGLTWQEIVELNEIEDPLILTIGQRIRIPSDVSVVIKGDGSVQPGWRTHTVEFGDTLLGIALQYGITLDDLLTANDLQAASILEVGNQLNIPPAD